MKIRKLAVIAGCAILLCGCTESHIIHPEEAGETIGPDFNIYSDIEIDEQQLRDDVKDIYIDPVDYPMAADIDFELHLDEEYVTVIAVVKDGTSPEDAALYADVAIKGINDEYAVQDYSYGTSDVDTFGGLYQDNEIELKLYEESAYTSGGDPFFEIRIPKETYMTFDIEAGEGVVVPME